MKRPDPATAPEPARIIVLNGTSSSGKTSLARAMQRHWKPSLHHVQLDAFRSMEPPGYWDGWEQLDTTVVAKMMEALCGAMHATVLQYASRGQQVVLDVALTNPQARHLLVEALAGWPVYLVAVHCALDELARREQNRGDRNVGLAASQFAWLHKHMRYDLEVDTTAQSPEALAASVLLWLDSAPTASALLQMQALRQAS